MATSYPPPSPPMIAARYKGGKQTPKAIVIHGTVSPDTPGTARKIANWWHGPTSPVTSAHYVTDPNEVIQCVGDHTVAYHCGYNTGSIAIELCDEQTGPASRWQDANSQAIIRRAARLTAELCLAYGIEARRPTVDELKAKGPHGIYGHNDSRLAFGHTSHVDPKDFPWAQFLNMVNAEIRAIKAAAAPSKPLPPTIKVSGVNSFVTQNVKSNPEMPQERVTHDVNLTSTQATVIGWQEISPKRYKAAIGELDPKVWESYIAMPNNFWYNSPISWKKGSWQLIAKGVEKIHDGVSGICGDRHLTWVLLRSRSTGGLVIFNNVHMVPGAFNPKADRYALRRRMWNDGNALHRATIKRLMSLYQNAAVVGFGDYNRKVKLGPVMGKTMWGRGVRTLAGGESIDHVWVINAKSGRTTLVTKGYEALGGRFSDHQGRRARLVVRFKA